MLNSKSIMERISANRNHWILCLILLVGTILRCYNLFNLPFSHDELSALLRTDFNSFHELIELGVKTDYHPAGIQVFLYYWVNLFGYSEWIVKLPFILVNIASIYLVFQIGKKWKNETVGLLCAAFLATTQYSVMYGTTARPYATGLFFILLLVNILLSIGRSTAIKTPYIKWIIFILSGVASAYNHHYSLFFAGIIGVLGLFILPRKFLLHYFISGVVIVLLYLPHIPILLHQLSKGGVGGANGWLGKPTPYFFTDYLNYLFHFSIWPFIVTIAIAVYGFFQSSFSKRTLVMMAIALGLFILPIVFGYYYSIIKNPILQYSILIFSHFFLYLFLFGHLKSLSSAKNMLLVIAILSVNVLTLVVNRQHYSINFLSIYEHVTLDLIDVRKETKNVPTMIECSPTILKFYDKQQTNPSEYDKYRDFESTSDRLRFLDSISEQSDYFYFGCTSFVDQNFVALIKTRFPNIIWQKNYFSGSTYLFTKTKKSNNEIIANYSTSNWSDGNTKLPRTIEAYYVIDSLEYGPSYVAKLQDLLVSPNDKIDIQVTLKPIAHGSNVQIVAQLESSDSLIQWSSFSSNDQEIRGTCNELVHTFQLSDRRNLGDIQLKIYLWNPSKIKVEFKDIEISRRPGNPIIYGLFEPL